MSTLTLPIESDAVGALDRPRFFPGVVGFYFVFRVCLTFLFFQADPVMGTIVNIAIDLALLYGAVLYSAEGQTYDRHSLLQTPPIRWIVALLALSLISALWTGAQSLVSALAYWMGMAADVAIVLQLLRLSEAVSCTQGIMKGMVWGAVALSLVAWCAPATPDLRLGNDAFLHPNTLGLEIGIATLIAPISLLPPALDATRSRNSRFGWWRPRPPTHLMTHGGSRRPPPLCWRRRYRPRRYHFITVQKLS